MKEFFKGPFQCYCTLSSFVNIVHIGYINSAHFSQNSFIYEIRSVFTFCPYSLNVTERSWKCVTALVKKNIYVKIVLHANIPARKAALLRNYFSRRNNFGLLGSHSLLSLSLSDFWPNKCRHSLSKGELPIPSNSHVSYSVSIPCFNMNGSEWALKMQPDICLSKHMVTFVEDRGELC